MCAECGALVECSKLIGRQFFVFQLSSHLESAMFQAAASYPKLAQAACALPSTFSTSAIALSLFAESSSKRSMPHVERLQVTKHLDQSFRTLVWCNKFQTYLSECDACCVRSCAEQCKIPEKGTLAMEMTRTNVG